MGCVCPWMPSAERTRRQTSPVEATCRCLNVWGSGFVVIAANWTSFAHSSACRQPVCVWNAISWLDPDVPPALTLETNVCVCVCCWMFNHLFICRISINEKETLENKGTVDACFIYVLILVLRWDQIFIESLTERRTYTYSLSLSTFPVHLKNKMTNERR